VIGLVIGLGTIDLLQRVKTPENYVSYFMGVGALIISIIFSLYAVKIRRYEDVADVNFLMEKVLDLK
jgi:hypothetical protein